MSWYKLMEFKKKNDIAEGLRVLSFLKNCFLFKARTISRLRVFKKIILYLIAMYYLGRFYQLVFHAVEPSELAVGWNSRWQGTSSCQCTTDECS